MKRFLVFISIILVAILVAITYHYFESAVHHSIHQVWDVWFDAASERLLVIPVCVVLSLAFFGLQHYLDPESEQHEAEGLGEAPSPTILNFAKVLFIGFFSLVAGASLGPEAILVPACLIIGGYVGTKLFKGDKQAIGILTMVGFVSLFAAFFDSFIAGLFGLLLVTKQTGVKIKPPLIIIAAIASEITVLALGVLEGSAYTELPANHWKISVVGLLAVAGLVVAGYATTYFLNSVHASFEKIHSNLKTKTWIIRAFVAAGGLSILYLLGGTLVEFTGNQSIQPMLAQAADLGVIGLLSIFVIKILAIGWSKALGYRGGLVFPSVFAASVLVAIAQTAVHDLSFTIGLIAALFGILAANAKTKTLF